jgi:hypothetical protein
VTTSTAKRRGAKPKGQSTKLPATASKRLELSPEMPPLPVDAPLTYEKLTTLVRAGLSYQEIKGACEDRFLEPLVELVRCATRQQKLMEHPFAATNPLFRLELEKLNQKTYDSIAPYLHARKQSMEITARSDPGLEERYKNLSEEEKKSLDLLLAKLEGVPPPIEGKAERVDAEESHLP